MFLHALHHSGFTPKYLIPGIIFLKLRQKIRKQLKKATGREFKIPENLAHASDVIYKFRKEIAAKAKYRLINKETGEPLKVVDHIGCHYSKMFPSKGVGGAEYPYVLIRYD